MKLEKILEILVSEFNKKNIDYALIGGYALGLLGVARATVDLDFLVKLEDMSEVDTIMHSLEYKKQYSSENVTQYKSSLQVFGEVDFLHAFRKISLNMLTAAIEIKAFNSNLTVKVLRPEDIIGLKVQAAVNDPERKESEFEDMKNLALEYFSTMDWELLSEYFELFDLSDMFTRLKDCAQKTTKQKGTKRKNGKAD